MFMRSIKVVIGWGGCLILLACDHVDEITPRKYVELIDSMAAPLRGEVAHALAEHPTKNVPMAGGLDPSFLKGLPVGFDFGWVTQGGVIMIYSEEYRVTYVREPSLVNGVVRWSCVVYPVDAKPALCGGED